MWRRTKYGVEETAKIFQEHVRENEADGSPTHKEHVQEHMASVEHAVKCWCKFRRMSQMKIYLQRSLPIDPKTGQMMPDVVDKRLPNPAVVTRISICAAHTCYSQVRQPWSKARPARSCALLLPTVARTVGSVFEMIDSRIYEPFDIFGGKGLASAEPLTQFQVVVYELSHS